LRHRTHRMQTPTRSDAEPATPPEPSIRPAPPHPRSFDRGWWLSVATLTALAAILRAPTLSLRHIVEGDGVHYADMARQAVAGDWTACIHAYWSNFWPAVMAAVSYATGADVVDGARFTSLVCGTLLVPVIALLGRDVFGRGSGLLAAAFVTVHPWLLHFSTMVFTESCFLLLVQSAILCGYLAMTRASVLASLGAAALVSCAFGTRQEGLAIAGVIGAGLAVTTVLRRRSDDASRLLRCTLSFAALFGAFLVARALLLQAYTGIWDFGFGAKGTFNFLLGPTPSGAEYEAAANSFTDDGERKLTVAARQSGMLGYVLANPSAFLSHLAANVERIRIAVQSILPPLPVAMGASWNPGSGPVLSAIGLAGYPVALAGFIGGFVRRGARAGNALLTVVAAAYFAGVAITMVHERLLLSFVPLFVLWLAHGCALLTRLLARSAQSGAAGDVGDQWRPGRRTLAVWSTIVATMAFVSLRGVLTAPVLAYADDPVVQREAGEWLAQRYPQDVRLMTPSPHVAHYFYRGASRRLDLPWGPFDQVMVFADKWQADLIAAPEWHMQGTKYPTAELLFAETAPAGLERVAIIGRQAPHRVWIYRIVR
jgi:hypothetical protein